MKAFKKYLRLFFDFFKIGLFTFGGGYAMISMISTELVEKRNYVSSEEFSDIVAIAESTPGPVAINSATFIGYKVGGVLGSIVSSIAVSLPSFLIIYLISVLLPKFLEYEVVTKAFKGVQCAVVVLIISASIKLFKNVKKSWLSYVLIILSATVLLLLDIFSKNVSTIYFILIGGVLGLCAYYPKMRKESKEKPANSAINAENEKIEDEKESE